MITLYDILKEIETVSTSHKLVNEYNEGDIYKHLNSGVHKYPLINLTIQNSSEPTKDVSEFTFNLFYVDRLTDDEGNKLNIYSVGHNVLRQIANKIEEDLDVNFVDRVYTYFNEKFADLCGGVYLTAKIEYPLGSGDALCSDDEFN